MWTKFTRLVRAAVESHHRVPNSWRLCAGYFIFRMLPDGSIRAICQRCGQISPGWGEPGQQPRQVYHGTLSFAELAEAREVLKHDPVVLPGWERDRRDERARRATEAAA